MAYTKAGRFGPKFVDGCAPGREATVYVVGTTTPATLYTSSDKSDEADNPVVLTGSRLSFYADPGTYTVKIAGNTSRVEVDPDASERHSQDVAAVVGDAPYDMDTLAEINASLSALPGTYLMVVQAGSNAETARPDGAIAVYWLCDDGVVPTNKLPGDIVFNADPPPGPIFIPDSAPGYSGTVALLLGSFAGGAVDAPDPLTGGAIMAGYVLLQAGQTPVQAEANAAPYVQRLSDGGVQGDGSAFPAGLLWGYAWGTGFAVANATVEMLPPTPPGVT